MVSGLPVTRKVKHEAVKRSFDSAALWVHSGTSDCGARWLESPLGAIQVLRNALFLEIGPPPPRARNSWYFGSKCYHVFSFATGIFMW